MLGLDQRDMSICAKSASGPLADVLDVLDLIIRRMPKSDDGNFVTGERSDATLEILRDPFLQAAAAIRDNTGLDDVATTLRSARGNLMAAIRAGKI